MTYPSFSVGEVLRATDMNAVGLWLVKSQTVGTGVSSVIVTDAFSADYTNYVVTLSGGTISSGNLDIGFQLRTAAGSTATTGYSSSMIYWSGSAITAFNQDNGSNWQNAGGGASTSARMRLDVTAPFLAQPTGMFAAVQRHDIRGSVNGFHTGATSYSAFVLTPNASTLTGGTIRVYGLKD
jgi:hypothetical protein